MAEQKKLKVAVWGTGNVASIAIRCLQGRDDMELVGVWAHEETAADVIGTDSGLLDLDVPNGVIITGDEEEIFALKPDCIVCAINVRNVMLATMINGDWYAKFLEHGINVVSPSVPDLMWPTRAMNKKIVEKVREAAEKGGASIYINGQEPGYAEQEAMTLASCSNTISRLTISELYNYSTTPSREEMSINFGFDEDPEEECMLEVPEIMNSVWGLTVNHLADYFGYELDKLDSSYEKWATDHPIKTAFGTIEPGKVAAVRLRTSGYIDGREAIVLEHVNRMEQGICPEWPSTDTVGTIRITIEGDPNLRVDMNVSPPDHPEELSYEGYVFTAMRIVNAIPEVCAAKPGILTVHDIGLPRPSNVFRSDAVHIEGHKISDPRKA